MRKKYLFNYDMTFITILSVVLFIIPSAVVYGFYLISRDRELFYPERYVIDLISKDMNIYYILGLAIFVIVVFFLWMVLHEVIHGIFYQLKGAKSKNVIYGMELEKGVFYCRCSEFIYKENVLLSLLAPFILTGVVTLIIGMAINSYLLIFLSVANISGAAGDISMFSFFLELQDPNMKFMELGDTLTFVIESYDDLSKVKNKGVIFVREVEDYEIKNDNSKKMNISVGSYVIILLTILLIIGLVLLKYLV